MHPHVDRCMHRSRMSAHVPTSQWRPSPVRCRLAGASCAGDAAGLAGSARIRPPERGRMVLDKPTAVVARPAFWNEVLAPYARPSLRRSISCLLTSVAPYAGLLVAMYFALQVSLALTLVTGVLTAGFLLRTYIVFHDCAHGSFLPSKKANIWLGSALGVLVYAPFQRWRHDHAVHHATAADLDRRGDGDVPTLTVAEYN